MENLCLAIATVPIQQWGQTYSLEEALAEGTIFPELNLPFFEAPKGSNTTLSRDGSPQLTYAQVCFAVDDVLLYLDTHPEDGKAREYYEALLEKKRELQQKAECGCCMASHMEWAKKPLVWEGGHC